MKEFGKKAKAAPVEPQPFKLNYVDSDGESQVFEGEVVPRSDGGGFAKIMSTLSSSDPKVVTYLTRMLAKMMNNSDGLVGAKWEPKALAKPTDLDEDEEADWTPSYRGPDGKIYPFNDTLVLEGWQDQDIWTTRRRWIYLMEEDDEAIVELEDLMEMMEWLLGLITERPTQPRA